MGWCYNLSTNSCTHYHGDWDRRTYHEGLFVVGDKQHESEKEDVKLIFGPQWDANFGILQFDERGNPFRTKEQKGGAANQAQEKKGKGPGGKRQRDNDSWRKSSPGKGGGKAAKNAAIKEGDDWRTASAPAKRNWETWGEWDTHSKREKRDWLDDDPWGGQCPW